MKEFAVFFQKIYLAEVRLLSFIHIHMILQGNQFFNLTATTKPFRRYISLLVVMLEVSVDAKKKLKVKIFFFFSLEQKLKVVESNEILKISCPLFVPGFVYISWISPFCFKYWCDQTSDLIWYSIYKGKIKTFNKEFSIERTFSLNLSILLLSTKCRPDCGMDLLASQYFF